LANAIRPVGTDCVGDGEQGTPVVGDPVNQPAHIGIVVADNVGDIIRPSTTHTGKVIQLLASIVSKLG
jgi:Na+/H+-translocating membrane pyrophosphatase